MSTLKHMENKHAKQYTCLYSDSVIGRGTKQKKSVKGLKNRKQKERKQKKRKRQQKAQEANRKHKSLKTSLTKNSTTME